jgi:hypothetical protein
MDMQWLDDGKTLSGRKDSCLFFGKGTKGKEWTEAQAVLLACLLAGARKVEDFAVLTVAFFLLLRSLASCFFVVPVYRKTNSGSAARKGCGMDGLDHGKWLTLLQRKNLMVVVGASRPGFGLCFLFFVVGGADG